MISIEVWFVVTIGGVGGDSNWMRHKMNFKGTSNILFLHLCVSVWGEGLHRY